LPGGPVGLPAWWAVTSNVAGGIGTEEGTRGPLAIEGRLSLDKLFAGVLDFLVTPLLVGPVCLISQDGMKSRSAPSNPRCVIVMLDR